MANSVESFVKIKQLSLVLGIFSLLLFACTDDEEAEPMGKPGDIGEIRKFWALDDDNRPYQVDAVLRAEGEYSKIWVQQSLSIGEATLSGLVSEYDRKIRPAVLEVFSVQGPIQDPESKQVVADNSLGWADYLGDGDKKLAILLLDMPTGSQGGGATIGYFWPLNFYSKNDPRDSVFRYSNESDMIYMNFHARPGSALFNNTLAHETQHLINFANSALLRRYYDPEFSMWDWQQMDVWVNEGLSAAAEYVYSKRYDEDRLDWFNDLTAKNGSQIFLGNNFFVWGENPEAILDEYATVYLFFQWLRLQAGGDNKIYQEIITSQQFDHEAVVNAIRGKGNYSEDSNLKWETLLRDWLLANLLSSRNFPGRSPKHSYMGDSTLSNLYVWPTPFRDGRGQEITQLPLFPGEGVYSRTQTAGTLYSNNEGLSIGRNIRYTAVDYSNTGALNHLGTSYAKGVLLSYNVNTVNDVDGNFSYFAEWQSALQSLLETARVSPDDSEYPAPRRNQATRNTALGAHVSRPQAISIWDMIRLREHKRTSENPALKNNTRALLKKSLLEN